MENQVETRKEVSEMEYKGPIKNADGSIDIMLNHPIYGWIPFTAKADDDGGKLLHEKILTSGEEIGVAPEEDKYAWRNYMEISSFQAKAMLMQAGFLPEVIAYMSEPESDPFMVLAWNEAGIFRRNSPSIVILAEYLGLNDLQLDDLFKFAITIEA